MMAAMKYDGGHIKGGHSGPSRHILILILLTMSGYLVSVGLSLKVASSYRSTARVTVDFAVHIHVDYRITEFVISVSL